MEPIRRVISIVSLNLAIALALAAHALGQQPVALTAPNVLLLDMKTGSILYSRGADEPMFPASMTKLMTLAVVFQELKAGRITLDTEYPVSEYAWRTGGAPSGTSTMFAAVRSRVRVEDLITGAASLSANDACIILAEGIAGSEQAFVGRMNELAKKLGLTTATFRNVTGFHRPEQKISARDLAKLAAHIIREHRNYYKYFSVPEFTWSKIRQSNRNPLLGLSLGVDGLKTGFVKESGYGMVASAEQNGQRLIAVVHGAKSEKDRAEDARKLLDWGFRSFSDRLLFSANNVIARASVYGGASGSVALTGSNDIHALSLTGTGERFTARVYYEGPIRAPIRKGTEVATLRVYRGDQLALETPLFAGEDVAAGTLAGRAFDAAYEWVGGLFRRAFRSLLTRPA